MARKRMLSPEIWESNSFSSLSDLGKIVFIGLISLSDDEGRGRANPSYIKSTLFPYDENRRVADVKSALSEIARCTSTQFYNVNGNDYYAFKNWKKWQKIDRPSKSKLPPPPYVGEGGDIPKNHLFDEYSTNTRRMLDECSSLIEENRIERNRKERESNREKEVNFTPPTLKEVETYCVERKNGISAQRFIEYYSSVGWKKGNTHIIDWKALIRSWEELDALKATGSKGTVKNGVISSDTKYDVINAEFDKRNKELI